MGRDLAGIPPLRDPARKIGAKKRQGRFGRDDKTIKVKQDARIEERFARSSLDVERDRRGRV
jgi:hypothetical protein